MLNTIEEVKFVKLKKACIELKVLPPPDVMISFKVHKDGILLLDDIQRGHSWTRNYYNNLAMHFAGMVGTDTVWGAGHMNANLQGWGCRSDMKSAMAETNGAIGDGYQGITVGTGDTAFSVEQYDLVARILHGTTSGKLSYAAEALPTCAYTALTKTWKSTLFRILNNNSGGSITVKEVGISSGHYNSDLHFMERSVLTPTVDVPDGARLTVTYEISMDFSAID
jgi:hypothetical protein